jgi:hypothetical protein
MRDEVIGQLVLDGLKAADGLAELPPFLGVVHDHVKLPTGRAMCARQQGQAHPVCP